MGYDVGLSWVVTERPSGSSGPEGPEIVSGASACRLPEMAPVAQRSCRGLASELGSGEIQFCQVGRSSVRRRHWIVVRRLNVVYTDCFASHGAF